MVSFKGKATMASGARILDDTRASKNSKDFKIYSGKERTKAGDPSRKVTGKVPAVVSRKSVPVSSCAKATALTDLNSGKGKAQGIENVMGKCDNSVKVRTGRKALADVSNLNSDRIYQWRNRLSNNPKLIKEKLEGSNISQGKSNSGNNLPRISLTKSVVVANASSRKPIRENVKFSMEVMGKLNVPVESIMRRKTLSEINSCRGCQRIQSHDNSKLIKNQGVKLLRPRLSFATQKVVDENTSSRKPVGTRATTMRTNSKMKRTPMIKHKSNLKKSITAEPCENKEAEELSRSNCDDNESVISQKFGPEKVQSDGIHCSNENVTAVISRSKRNRRKSYTSSLVARSEIMSECAVFVKKDELPNIDDNMDPLEVVEYVDDIYQYYWTMEVQNPLLANYMAVQSDITPRMRDILINWLIEVHLKFQLMQETLFLMVELLDRVLSVVPIKKDELQMVGLTALLLASKYEDYWHPKISELISISANLYTRDQMLAMEKLILKKLRFRLNVPTPYVFMLRFLKAAQSDKKLEDLAFYLIELCLVEYEALEYRPSLLCASAIYVARCTLQMTPAWTGLLRKYARYEESQLRACAEMILGFQRAACLKPTKITYEKFLSADRSCVAAVEVMDVLPL